MRGLWLGVHCGTPRPPRRMRADPPAASVRLTSARTETGGSGNRRAVQAFLLCASEFDVFREHASGLAQGTRALPDFAHLAPALRRPRSRRPRPSPRPIGWPRGSEPAARPIAPRLHPRSRPSRRQPSGERPDVWPRRPTAVALQPRATHERSDAAHVTSRALSGRPEGAPRIRM